MKRHTCIICKQKRYENKMVNVFGNAWACETQKKGIYLGGYNCYCHSDIIVAKQMIELSKQLKIINIKHIF